MRVNAEQRHNPKFTNRFTYIKMTEFPWTIKFLEALAETGNVSKAAKKAGITRRRAYQVKEQEADFSQFWDDAIQIAADAMEEEARRRAVTGVLEPVFYQGSKVGTIRRYSDTLLIFLLKGIRPEKYRERFEHTHNWQQLAQQQGVPPEHAERIFAADVDAMTGVLLENDATA